MIWPLFKKLEKKLINNQFSEKTGILYLVSLLLMVTILLKVPGIHSGGLSSGLILNLLICAWGVGRTLEINKNSPYDDYLKKFMSLSFINAVKLCAGLLIFTLVLKAIKYFTEFLSPGLMQGPILDGVPKFVIGAIASVIFFIMLINSFKRVNAEEEELSTN